MGGEEDSSSRAASKLDARGAVRCALALNGLIAALGLLARWQTETSGMARPTRANIYFRLYALFELPFLILVLVFVGVTTALLFAARHNEGASTRSVLRSLAPPRAWHIALVATVVTLAGVAITHLVLHDALLSMDEFGADFQARIFARGELAPSVGWPWRSLEDAIVPIFVYLRPTSGRWAAEYLPVYSAIKSVFLLAHLEAWLNPLLSAGALVSLAAVARRLWPTEGLRPLVAVALLATSSQFLVTSGTGYSMPAHLFLNLLWLWLYLRGDARSWAAALVVGVLAMGLHNPFPHTLFVAPFMLRLLRQRRWGRLASAAVAYVAGAVLWLAWLRFVHPVASGSNSGLMGLFAFPDAGVIALHVMNLSLLASWNAPVLGLLVLAAVMRPRELDEVQRDLALGVLATLAFFMFFPSTQGHGWGYRYAHQVLGNLCLLAAAGLPTLSATIGERRSRHLVAAGLATALVVQVPLRLRDTEGFVRPFAKGFEYVRSRDATVLLVRGDSIWYGQDLIRNDPFLQYPVVVRQRRLAPQLIEQMKRMMPGRVIELSDAELLQLGMTATVPLIPFDGTLPRPMR
jgi:hypothetical protein